jgi:signal peptidase I
MAVILAMAAFGAWAFLTGQFSYVVTDGISMNPVYYHGDLVIVQRSDTYRIGQNVAYEAKRGQKVLHRIVGGDAARGFVFKGDNNESIDPLRPTMKEIIGRAVVHVPRGGIWLKPLLSPSGLGMIGFLIVGGGAARRTRREIPRGRRKKKVRAMSRQGSALTTVVKTIARLPAPLQVASGLVAALGSLAIVLGVLGWMKPALQQTPAPSQPVQSVTFSYSATVPRSAAYDGTVARSPDPIFRKLAERVDLKVSYEGHPGTFELTVTLSDPSGWHTTMPLVGPKRFSGRFTEVTAVLDLKAMEDRAADAAKAIGITAGAVSIAVNAQVKRGTETFTAPLGLQLDDLLLKLLNGASSLVVHDSKVAAPSVTPRRIGSIMTAVQARSYAVLLLLAAAVGAACIALIARRKLPLRTREEIERRFPSLLVHVEQMASPPGKPVVNVDNFPALVKLAERYGQMILTWRRTDADDFVVRDEGITYRYRIPLEEPALQNVEHINRPPNTDPHRRKDSSQVS